jgi:hypothetical protein
LSRGSAGGAENVTETDEGDTREDSNNGNDNKKFDKGETLFSMGFFHIL